jgi:hypothetical protein
MCAKLEVKGVQVEDKIAVVHMSTSWESRTWSLSNWKKVMVHLTSKGFKVVVVGKGSDLRPSKKTEGVYDLVNHFSIHEVRELVKSSDVFLGMDSGLMHIASTTKTPIVALFTVANPANRLVREKDVTWVVPEVECKFCLHEFEPPVTTHYCPRGDLQCVKDITPEKVIKAVNPYLGTSRKNVDWVREVRKQKGRPSGNRISMPLRFGAVLEQPFTSTQDEVSSLEVFGATYCQQIGSPAEFEVEVEGKVMAKGQISYMKDNDWWSLPVRSLKIKDKKAVLRIRNTDRRPIAFYLDNIGENAIVDSLNIRSPIVLRES